MPLNPGTPDVLAAPTNVAVVQNSFGSGAAISYNVVAVSAGGQDSVLSLAAVTPATNNATPNNTITWAAVPGAVGYRIIKGGNLLANVGAGVTSYTDSAGSSGVSYTAATTAPSLLVPGATALIGGTKATYTYAVQATAPYATPSDWVVIRGSATRTIKILRVELSGAATAATEVIWLLNKHTVANTAGTSTNPTPVQHDSNDPAASALVLLYSVAPTISGTATLWKTARMTAAVAPAATANNPDRYVWEAGANPAEPLVLRGVAQEFAVNFNGATVPSGGVFDLAIVWSEE